MKWEKAKTILIVFFIIINLFFITYIVGDNIHALRIEEQVADSVVELMSKNGITVDKKLITDAFGQKSMKTVYVKNIINSYGEFAKNVLGDDIIQVNEQEFKGENGSITFKGDYFEVKAEQGKYLHSADINSSNAEKTAVDYISSVGVNEPELKGELAEKDGKYCIYFDKKINGYKVFEVGIAVIADNNGIKEMYGSWFNEQEGVNSVKELKKASGTLIEYMNNNKKSGTVIKDISLGYATLEAMLYHESVLLTPVWAITEESGDSVYIDAREN